MDKNLETSSVPVVNEPDKTIKEARDSTARAASRDG